jgi:hypothetical protein
MDEADIYFVDTRNADAPHRPVVRPGTYGPSRAVVVPAAAPPASRVTYVPPPAAPPGYAGTPYPTSYPATFWNPQNPVYAPPPHVYGQPPFMGTLGALFGGINIGQVIDLAGQGFAALKSLPAAPASTGDVSTDVANLTLYQRALAEHGKLDEQIRTGVHIVAKLLGA